MRNYELNEKELMILSIVFDKILDKRELRNTELEDLKVIRNNIRFFKK